MSPSEVCVCPWLFMSLHAHPEVREQACSAYCECTGGNLCVSHIYPCLYGAVCMYTCQWTSSHQSVCRHARVFMYIHTCICTHLVLSICVWVQKHVSSVSCLSKPLCVSGHTGPWLCVRASCCTSAWPMCSHAWAQLDFVCELPCAPVGLQPAACSVLRFYSDPRRN